MTLSADLNNVGHHAWLSVTLAGLGPRLGATAATLAYRLCSDEVDGDTGGTIDADRALSCMTELPATISERIDLLTGVTDLGPISLKLRHAVTPPAADGWDSLFDWLSVHQPATEWELTAGVSAAAVLFVLASNAGLAVGQVIYLGSEAVVVEAVDGLGFQITVARGMYGTSAVAHDPIPDGDGTIYSRPRYLRGRRVELLLNLRDPSAQGDLVYPPAQEISVWAGLLDDWRMTSPGEIELTCKPTLSRLDRTILRDQWTGVAFLPVSWAGPNGDPVSGLESLPAPITVDVPDGAQLVLPAAVPAADPGGEGWIRRFYARIGDSLCELECWTVAETDTSGGRYLLIAVGLLHTDETEIWEAEDGLQIAQVWPTSARPDQRGYDARTPLQPFTISGDAVASEHPADIARMLITSTGEAANGSWDVLPAGCGAQLPVAEVDADSWNALTWSTGGLRFPSLILGWDAEPVRLREWLEKEILGPLGWWLHQTVDGTIGIGRLQDVYPGDELTGLDRIMHGPGVQLNGQLGSTVSLQTWRYGWDWQADRFRRVRLVTGVAARDRLTEDDSEIEIECRGIEVGEATGETTIGERIASMGRWWVSPLPRLSLTVPLARIEDISVGTLVELDALDWPCPLTGGSSWAGISGLVISRSVSLRPPGLPLEIQPLPDGPRGRWAPSATVVSCDVTKKIITVESADFTNADDSAAFEAGELVALYDSHGVPVCDEPATIVTSVADVITIAATFKLAAADVLPAVGDIITFPRWKDGAAPEGTWADPMDDCVAQADGTATPPDLPDGSDPYDYGS